ncbi:MAG: zf-TFIIB domain-containing protein [Ignavibacteriaceae bacterium]
MFCPVCKEPMIILELNEVEIDYCPSCSGIWLDAGELELLFEDQAEREKIISSFNISARIIMVYGLTRVNLKPY